MAKQSIIVLFEDDNLIVIHKPAGISVTADRSGQEDILQCMTRQQKRPEKLRLIHRLDKDTSGVMLLAKTVEMQRRCTEWLEQRRIRKTYLALVAGYVSPPTGVIEAGLGRLSHDSQRMCVDPKKGKPAVTEYDLLADFGGVALVLARPITGRTHQIRVHFAHQGFPLAIDALYGATRPILLSDFKMGYTVKGKEEESPLIDRLTLHAYQLELPEDCGFPSPLIAPLEKKFAAAVK
ncbi:MAG: RNA pseudouridine synthase, partial [Phycisphaerae bacterium]|nr:RNA pseudouridine synthase [Phycisphaerae bacterium]